MAILTFDTYGKTGVRLTQVTREAGRHDVVEVSVQILFEGDFAKSYTAGDNANVLPTDTMKNTVYAIARQRPIVSIEVFASDLAQHFLARLSHLAKVIVEIQETPWIRIGGHDSAFLKAGTERRSSVLTATRFDEILVSGIRDLEILKTSNSAFADYIRDEYTTLPETRDRLLGTALDADWSYGPGSIDYNVCHKGVRQLLLDSFAKHTSLSVQHTLYAMGQAVLDAFGIVEGIHLTMPNKHRLLVDLSRFDLDNPNQIFVPTDEPSGYIEAHLKR